MNYAASIALSIVVAGAVAEKDPETGALVLPQIAMTTPQELGEAVVDLWITADGGLWKGPAHAEGERLMLAAYAEHKGKFGHLRDCEQVYAGYNLVVRTPREGVVHVGGHRTYQNPDYLSRTLRMGGC